VGLSALTPKRGSRSDQVKATGVTAERMVSPVRILDQEVTGAVRCFAGRPGLKESAHSTACRRETRAERMQRGTGSEET
jgi:hypothetical protein